MADQDLSFLVGELRGEFKAIKDHLTDQDRRTEINKRAAIDARQALTDKVDVIGATSAANATWIKEKGDPMHAAWLAQSQKATVDGAERRGGLKVWGSIVAVGGTIVTVAGFLGKEAIASVLERIAKVLH